MSARTGAGRRRRAGLLALCAGAILLLCSCGGQVSEDSRRADLARFFGADVRPRNAGAFGLDRWSAIEATGPHALGRALRVEYPAGSVSPAATREYGAPGGGMQVYLPRVGGPLDEAYLRYWVRMSPGFDFVKGGKLPGLWGGTEGSGGDEPDGTNGFSTRLMWRVDGAGEVYLYAPDNSGTSLGRGSWTWPADEWTCVEQRVVLNDADDDNGAVTVWLNNKQVYEKTDLRYRTVDSLKIEGIFFSTFFGGADATWATPKDQYADFAGFKLSTARIGCTS